MIATSILTILALKSVFKFSSTQAIVSTALLNICVDQNTIFSCHISILLCELLFEVLYSSCDAAHNNRGKTSSVYYICCPMGWYRHCLELSSNFCTNATLYGHEALVWYIMRIILDITTFIGLNRYRLSFIISSLSGYRQVSSNGQQQISINLSNYLFDFYSEFHADRAYSRLQKSSGHMLC